MAAFRHFLTVRGLFLSRCEQTAQQRGFQLVAVQISIRNLHHAVGIARIGRIQFCLKRQAAAQKPQQNIISPAAAEGPPADFLAGGRIRNDPLYPLNFSVSVVDRLPEFLVGNLFRMARDRVDFFRPFFLLSFFITISAKKAQQTVAVFFAIISYVAQTSQGHDAMKEKKEIRHQVDLFLSLVPRTPGNDTAIIIWCRRFCRRRRRDRGRYSRGRSDARQGRRSKCPRRDGRRRGPSGLREPRWCT